MTVRHNPALSEEPRNQPMKNVPLIARESLFSWLESTGRFQAVESDELQDQKMVEDIDDILDPEIYTVEDEEE
jgi:hypothetical protein